MHNKKTRLVKQTSPQPQLCPEPIKGSPGSSRVIARDPSQDRDGTGRLKGEEYALLQRFDTERVASLKAAIQQGHYHIDIKKLANQLLKFEKQFFSP